MTSEIQAIKVQGQSCEMRIKKGSGAIQTNNINVAWSLNKHGRKKKEVDICHVFIYLFFYKKLVVNLLKRRIGKKFCSINEMISGHSETQIPVGWSSGNSIGTSLLH